MVECDNVVFSHYYNPQRAELLEKHDSFGQKMKSKAMYAFEHQELCFS